MMPNPYRPKFDALISARSAARILEISAPTIAVLVLDGILPKCGDKFRKTAVLRLKQNPVITEEN